MVTVPLPHLSGLAGAVRVAIDDRVPTMGVFASGRIVANREFVARLKDNELVFVLAHELLHLALRTHDRAKGSGQLEFNYAHDYIINDILRVELGFDVDPRRRAGHAGRARKIGRGDRAGVPQGRPADAIANAGLGRPGRRRRTGSSAANRQRAGQRGGEGPEAGEAELAGDVLGDKLEREWYADDADDQADSARRIEELAAKGLALAKALAAIKGRGSDTGASASGHGGAARALPHAVADGVAEMAGIGCARRAHLRAPVPAQRGAQRPGPARTQARVLDAQRAARHQRLDDQRNPARARRHCRVLRRCWRWTASAWSSATARSSRTRVLSPDELAAYQVSGFGGSNLSPAMLALADDPRVTAAVIVTDGDIEYPSEDMPYRVLWVLPARGSFAPRYGMVITMEGEPQ